MLKIFLSGNIIILSGQSLSVQLNSFGNSWLKQSHHYQKKESPAISDKKAEFNNLVLLT